MSANNTRSTLSRQWQLLQLLPQRGSGDTARELTRKLAEAGFKTTKRTVERDLEELSRVFPLRCNNKSKPYGWSWTVPGNLQLSAITLPEALTLKLTEESLRPLFPAHLFAAPCTTF